MVALFLVGLVGLTLSWLWARRRFLKFKVSDDRIRAFSDKHWVALALLYAAWISAIYAFNAHRFDPHWLRHSTAMSAGLFAIFMAVGAGRHMWVTRRAIRP